MAVPAVARSLTIVGILGLLLLSDFLMHVHEAHVPKLARRHVVGLCAGNDVALADRTGECRCC